MPEINTPHTPDDGFTHEVAQNVQKRLRLTPRGAGAAGLAIGLAAGVIGPEVVDTLDGPEFSESTKVVVVEHNGNLWNLLDEVEGIEGVNKQDVVSYVQHLPANADIDFTNLQSGTSIEIPVTVER